MPRERKHIAEAQLQRIKIKEKGVKHAPGTVTLQVLGSGAPGAPASIYLFTDQSRYLFNCGEGTQRLAHEHKTKLVRLEHIFMTRTSWDRLGGLPGLSLTVQDAGVPDLTLHGPPGLDEIFRGMRKFVVLKDLKVQTINCENGGEYDDQVINVLYVPLKRSNPEGVSDRGNTNSPVLEEDETDYYAYENNGKSSNTSPQKVESTRRREDVVLSYICKLKPRPGVLNLEKCVDKGVPPGPFLGQLKNGVDVTLPDGTLVRADDVRGPSDPGPVFIFIDIPSEHYLESLERESSVFEKYQATAACEDDVALVVVHFSPRNVMEKEIYRNFMDKFTPSTKHLVLNETNKFSGYLAAHRIQWQLNQLNNYVFPLLKENFDMKNLTKNYSKKVRLSSASQSSHQDGDEEQSYERNLLDSIVNQVNSLTSYHLRPRKGLDHSCDPIINPQEYINETSAVEGFTESLNELRRKLSHVYPSPSKYIREEDFPKIIFLGTGSCIPNKTRNVSAILLQTSENSSMLLDCGEGTWGQIIRFFGVEKAIGVLRNMKAIFVSHLHADHHIGLIGILKARLALKAEVPPLVLLAPKQIQSWLHFYDLRIEPISQGYYLVPNGDVLTSPLRNKDTASLGIRSISTCFVRHCPYAFGIALELDSSKNSQKNPIKITYSGDTVPCDDLVKLGQNSTILIHEATMEDELLNQAKSKMHSTVSQAIEQGIKMNAKYIILTHFSQRYAKLPCLEEFPGENVGIAFDNMEVTLRDLDHLHLLYQTLKIMFTEHCEDMKQKAIKRALRKELKRRSSSDSSPTR